MNKTLFSICSLLLALLTFLQRLPFFIFTIFSFLIFYFLFILTRKNIIMIYWYKMILGVFNFLNGIKIQVDPKLKNLAPGLIICNFHENVDYSLLYLILPNYKIMLKPKELFVFFQKRFINRLYSKLLYILGFFPTELSSYEKYLAAGFFVIECARFQAAQRSDIPFVLMLGIKEQKPVYIIDIEGSDNLIFSSFFLPRKVTISLKGKIEPDPDAKIMINDYLQISKNLINY